MNSSIDTEPDKMLVYITDRASGGELWLLRLHAASGLHPVLFGLICGFIAFSVVASPLLGSGSNSQDQLSSAAFFAFSITIIAAATPHMFRGAAEDFVALSPMLDMKPEEVTLFQRALVRMPNQQLWWFTAIGASIGLVHAWILGALSMNLEGLTQTFATLWIWVTMMWTVPALIGNAITFSSLGGRAKPNLLLPASITPFGMAAVRPIIFIVGMLSAYSILLSTSAVGPSLIGFIACMGSAFGLFFIPLRGIRKTIREEKQKAISTLDKQIAEYQNLASMSTNELSSLDALLTLRDRISAVSSWPLGLAGVRRVMIYVVIPPLTWSAAAIVEMLISQQF